MRLESAGGTFGIYWMTQWPGGHAMGPHHRRLPADPADGGWDLADGKRHRFMRFAYDVTPTQTSALGATPRTLSPSGIVVAPYWFLTFVAGVLPAWQLARVAARGRRRADVCAFCGYDLRATPGRCPECGTAAAVSTTR